MVRPKAELHAHGTVCKASHRVDPCPVQARSPGGRNARHSRSTTGNYPRAAPKGFQAVPPLPGRLRPEATASLPALSSVDGLLRNAIRPLATRAEQGWLVLAARSSKSSAGFDRARSPSLQYGTRGLGLFREIGVKGLGSYNSRVSATLSQPSRQERQRVGKRWWASIGVVPVQRPAHGTASR